MFDAVQGFLKNERENALLAVIEHTRKNVRFSVLVGYLGLPSESAVFRLPSDEAIFGIIGPMHIHDKLREEEPSYWLLHHKRVDSCTWHRSLYYKMLQRRVSCSYEVF